MNLEAVGIYEIAKAAGVSHTAVCNWTERHPDFPAPIITIKVGSIWHWPDVAEWLTKTGRAYS